MNANSQKSLLQSSYELLKNCTEEIVSMTNTKHNANVRVQLSKLSENPVILSEPVAKNTAPAIALGTKFIVQNFDNDPIILAIPSDLLIKDTEKFINTMKKGEEIAKQGYIVTFGVKPDYPETGYGYIETAKSEEQRAEGQEGKQLTVESGKLKVESLSSNNNEISQEQQPDTVLSPYRPIALSPSDINPSTNTKVIRFIEKPDEETAKKFINDGNYFWNSGIFMFKASVFFEELNKHAPEIAKLLDKFDFSGTNEIPFIDFDKMPNISIDYALMEKSKRLALVKLESDWKDLGSWQSIYDISPKDENGNVFVGHVLDENSKNSFVYSSSKLVATIGLEDTVIVETEDAILACKKDRTQDVKKIYETLKQQHDNTHLVHKTVFRPWGFYTVIAQGEGFLTKIIHVNKGQRLSVQSHNFRSEHWVVLSGTAKVVLEGKDLILSSGHSVDIPLKAIHSLQNPYEEDLEIIEVQKGDPLIEEDIVRYEDMYGRV